MGQTLEGTWGVCGEGVALTFQIKNNNIVHFPSLIMELRRELHSNIPSAGPTKVVALSVLKGYFGK